MDPRKELVVKHTQIVQIPAVLFQCLEAMMIKDEQLRRDELDIVPATPPPGASSSDLEDNDHMDPDQIQQMSFRGDGYNVV